jgi:hypothetical protein
MEFAQASEDLQFGTQVDNNVRYKATSSSHRILLNTTMICLKPDVDATLRVGLRDVHCSIPRTKRSPCDPCMELANLENFIVELEKKRSELKRNINRTHSPFMRMIPPEIIARISGFTNTDFTIMGSLPAPILLSSVCSDWRRAVVGSPRLWSSIKIDLPYVSKTSKMAYDTFLRLAAFIDEWLARSGQLPLHISLFSCHEVPDPRSLEKYRTIFKILDRYSSRWHSLDISFTPTIFLCLQPDHLPLLEQLHVDVPFNIRNPERVLAFPPSPRLKEVKIHAFIHSVLPSLPDIGIQWDNVTHVSAESLTIQTCFKFLRLVPQLVHCKFHNIIVDAHNPPLRDLESPIFIPTLTYLLLSCYQRSPCSFLDKVVLPSLETLVLVYISSMDPLLAFLKRSACSLHTLSLQQLNIKKVDSLTRLLQFLSPSLTKLVISQSPGRPNEGYLSMLTQSYTSQTRGAAGNDFLPHLEFFGYGEGFDSSVMGPYPKRTSTTPAIALRSAYIDLDRVEAYQRLSKDVLAILECLKEDGILRTDSRFCI